MTSRITKNELVAINARLAQENAALRVQLSAQQTQLDAALGKSTQRSNAQLRAHHAATTTRTPMQQRAIAGLQRAVEAREQRATTKAPRRPLASFFALADAGQYITGLKQRGCKVTLTAVRSANHFVVFAG